MLDILVPVLARPHQVKPLLESIARSTRVGYRVLFIADRYDAEEIAAVESAQEWDENAALMIFDGNYAQKINRGVRETSSPFVFFGADDLRFYPGWFTCASWEYMVHSVEVVGVNDLCSERVQRGEHATHFLVTRRYCEAPTVDEEPGPLCELYSHWFVDDEFVEVCKARGVISFAQDAIVEHLHYMNGKAEMDHTYEIGRSRARMDRRRFHRRMHLWTSP